MKIGIKEFDLQHKTYVMGILNITPDSFSDGGQYNRLDQALFRAEKMIRDGADILDVGGESTRPGYTKISDEEEIQRVTPVIEQLVKEFEVPVSVDTYKSRVARAAIGAGVHLINDIRGLKYDENMAQVIGEANLPCVLMHNKEKPVYKNLIEDMLQDLKDTIKIALDAGISKDKIILDPGVGFGKTNEQNLEIIRKLEQFHVLGYPLLLGTSRKSVIGNTLKLPVEERVEGTLVTTVQAVRCRYGLVRVHDVRENVRAIRMAEAIYGSDCN